MERVVAEHGTAADNPWAVGHAMLALGPDVTLSNGQPAVDWLFSEYAEYQDVGGVAGVAFPAKRGLVRIEPHTDLLLKAVTEGGVKPERPVKVEGRDVTVADLYKRSLCAAWVDGDKTAFGSWNDTPWSLQGLSLIHI